MRDKITEFEIKKYLLQHRYHVLYQRHDLRRPTSQTSCSASHRIGRRDTQPCSTSNDAMCMQPPGSRTLNLRVDSRLNQDGLWDPP